MAGRISPTHNPSNKNLLGPKLKRLRKAKKIRAVSVVAALQRRGWDVSPAVFSHLEAGKRLLTDKELLMILDILGVRLRDLED